MAEKSYDYLSDEELNSLINDVEQHEMLQAKSYIKRELIHKVVTQTDTAKIQVLGTQTDATKMQAVETQTDTAETEATNTDITDVKTVSMLSTRLSNKQKKQKLMMYKLKISFVAAAAILALFLIPTGDNGQIYHGEASTKSQSIVDQMNKSTENVCTKLFDFSNSIIPR